jgi:hypothetical protein
MVADRYAIVLEHGIIKCEEAPADVGSIVLSHNHRTFVERGGEPQRDVDPWRRIGEWRRAIF